jgi:hypothetical protein
MENITELVAVVSLFLGLPTIVAAWSLGRKYLTLVERREDTRRQELAIAERRIVLEERERELEIYKLEIEIRRLEGETEDVESLKNRQLP